MTHAAYPPELWIGLISGTSRDAIEAVVARFETDATGVLRATVLAHHSEPYRAALRADLDRVLRAPASSLAEIATLDAAVGDAFATAALRALAASEADIDTITGVASHGQTLHHGAGRDHASRTTTDMPSENAEADRADKPAPHYSWQIGDPFRIAEQTGLSVWHDFRRADVAAGGEGAPLACGLHAALFRAPDEPRAVLNLGGISNLTLLADGQPVRGFDCGPANTLLDHHIQQARGLDFDDQGRWAQSGRVDRAFLACLLDDDYLRMPLPKSTGIEWFSPAWLEHRIDAARIDAMAIPAGADLQATLAAFTVECVVDALQKSSDQLATQWPQRVLVCGGGAFNLDVLDRLRTAMNDASMQRGAGPVIVETTAAHGVEPTRVEALAFAWMGWRAAHGCAGNVPEVTGARGPRVLGSCIPGRARQR